MSRHLLYPAKPNVISRTRWYISIRWFILAAIAVPSVLSLFVVEGWSQQVQRDTLLTATAILSNGIFFAITRVIKKPSAYKKLAITLMVVETLLVTYLIFTKGGVESRSPILYMIPILMSAATLGRRAIYAAMALAVISYDSLILLDYFNIIHSIGAVNPTLRSDFPYVLNTVVFFSSVLIILGVMVDFITKLLINKERQASEHLEDLKQAQAIAKYGSWEWNVRDDHVAWSDELYRIFGLPQGEPVTFESYMRLIHPDDTKLVQGQLEMADKKRRPFSFDHKIKTPDGTVRYVHSDGIPVFDEDGSMIRMIGTAQDITEARRLDEAKSEFVSLASHQLRTPATGVKQYTAMLLGGYAGPLEPQQQKFLQTAYDSNERQLRIINDLLNVAQVDAERLKLSISEVDLVRLISDVIDEQRSKFESKNQQILFRPRYKAVVCKADEQRLRMAIENIIDNAHKYTLTGKKITVRIIRKNNKITIQIADQGVGIAEKDKHKIFDKFARIHNSETSHEEGSGLGLYWAYRVISMHGGDLLVDSVPNKGTTFSIVLPCKAKSK